jgi:hypothetical protein
MSRRQGLSLLQVPENNLIIPNSRISPKECMSVQWRNHFPRGGNKNSAIGGKNSGFQYLISDKAHKVKFYNPREKFNTLA